MRVSPLFAAVAVLAGTISSALADAAPVDMASNAACRLDRVREIIAGAETAGSDVDRLIVENTADWLPEYNVFAESPDAADLRAATDVVVGRPSRAECRVLVPFAAVSASAERISRAGGTVVAGSVLESCGDELCLPAATGRVIDQCGVALFRLPLRSTC